MCMTSGAGAPKSFRIRVGSCAESVQVWLRVLLFLPPAAIGRIV